VNKLDIETNFHFVLYFLANNFLFDIDYYLIHFVVDNLDDVHCQHYDFDILVVVVVVVIDSSIVINTFGAL